MCQVHLKTLYLQVQTRRQSPEWIHQSTHYVTEGGQLEEGEVEQDMADCACTEEPPAHGLQQKKLKPLAVDQRSPSGSESH